MRVLGCLVLIACTHAVPSTIPFTLTAEQAVIVPATLNDVDAVQLVLHTATADVRMTADAVAKATSLKFAGTAKVGSWGGGGTSRVSEHNYLRIGPWSHPVTVWEDESSSRGSDGKFGLDFFEGKVVELDLTHRRLVVHERLPAKAARYQRLALELVDGEPFITATCTIAGQRFTTKFMVHSGYAGGVLFADAFAKRMDGKLAITDTQWLADSFGNKVAVRKAVLPILELGAARLTDVAAGFFSGGQELQSTSVIGSAVLARFDLIFDVAHGALYIAPRLP